MALTLRPSPDLHASCQAGFPTSRLHVTVGTTFLCVPLCPWLAEDELSVLGGLCSSSKSAYFSLFLVFIGTSAPVTFKEWTIPLGTVTSHRWATGELPGHQWKLLSADNTAECNFLQSTPTSLSPSCREWKAVSGVAWEPYSDLSVVTWAAQVLQ